MNKKIFGIVLLVAGAYGLTKAFGSSGNSAPADNPSPTTPETLSLGSSGEAVKALQRSLNARTPNLPPLAVDGKFGPKTAERLKLVTGEISIKTTEVNPYTQAPWNRVLKLGTIDPFVGVINQYLNKTLGYPKTVTNVFDQSTQTGVALLLGKKEITAGDFRLYLDRVKASI